MLISSLVVGLRYPTKRDSARLASFTLNGLVRNGALPRVCEFRRPEPEAQTLAGRTLAGFKLPGRSCYRSQLSLGCNLINEVSRDLGMHLGF